MHTHTLSPSLSYYTHTYTHTHTHTYIVPPSLPPSLTLALVALQVLEAQVHHVVQLHSLPHSLTRQGGSGSSSGQSEEQRAQHDE
jgi:hypothetical protein